MYGSGCWHGGSTANSRLGTPCIPLKTEFAERGGDAPWLIRELIVNQSIHPSCLFLTKMLSASGGFAA